MGISKSVLSHFISKVLGSVAGFIATFAIARVLGADALGAYALAQGLMVWMTVPSHGVSTATTKYVSEGENENEFGTVGILLNISLVVVMSALLLLFEGRVNGYVGAEATELVVLLVFSTIFFGTVGGILRGEKKVARFGWLTTAEKVLRTLFQVGLILLGYEVGGLILGHAGSLILTSVIGLYFLRTRPTLPGRDEVRRMYDYAKYAWLGSTKRKMFGWMDTIVLGFFVSSSFIGIYEVAWTVSSFLILSSNSIRNVLFPEVSELSSEGREDEILGYVSESVLYTGVIVVPGLFGAAVVGPDLLSIYRPEFAKGATVLLILILAQLANVYGKQFVDILNAVNRPDAAFRVNGVFVVTNLSLNFALIYAIGWYGAAIATLVSGIVTLVLGYYYITRLLGSLSVPWRGILSQLFSSAVMGVAVYYLRGIAPPSHYGTVAVVFAGALLYGAVLLSVSPRIRRGFLNAAAEFR